MLNGTEVPSNCMFQWNELHATTWITLRKILLKKEKSIVKEYV